MRFVLLLGLLILEATADDSQYTEVDRLQAAVLNGTNTYRHQHDVPAVTWNETIAAYAADQVDRCRFAHSNGPYGENLAQGYASVTSAIDAWGLERDQYSFSQPGNAEQTGHFTQLVWANTTTTGCAAKDCANHGWLLFCEYFPRGNVIGQYIEQVRPQSTSTGLNGSSDGDSSRTSDEKRVPPRGAKGLNGWVVHVHDQMSSSPKAFSVDHWLVWWAVLAISSCLWV